MPQNGKGAKSKGSKNGRKPVKNLKVKRGMRSRADRVLAQNTGCSVPQAFGAEKAQRNLCCWDAKLPHHLPLPRAVGPYTVIRTTRRVLTSKAMNVIGTYMAPGAGGGFGATGGMPEWTDVCLSGDVDQNLLVNAASNTVLISLPIDSLGSAATVCPSALSVQIMNPQALQTSKGIVYAGVMNTQAAIAGRAESWVSYANKFIQYQSPRLMSAGKLALRGVQIDSYPLNMAEVSNFTPLRKIGDRSAATYSDNSMEPRGWAPIVIYNGGAGGADGLELELLITVEWRVRFDLDNPASASHTHHPVASDGLWDTLMRRATALGHGVKDIAELAAVAAPAIATARALMA